MADWKVGDVVYLKSGSPEMSVFSVGNHPSSSTAVTCVWFDGVKRCEGLFEPQMLLSKAEYDAK